MADIFISYAREDQPVASSLAASLEERGWSVWWDRDIPVGKDYDLIIERELDAAGCVIVLWTKDSVRSRNVKDEANEALNFEKLLPVLIGAIRPPMGFRMIQSLLWQDAGTAGQQLEQLAGHLEKMIGKPAMRPPEKQAAGAGKKPAGPLRGEASAEPPARKAAIKAAPKIKATPKKQAARRAKAAPPATLPDEQALLNIIREHSRLTDTFIYPNILASKEKNARSSCFIPADQKLLAIVDLTVFGAADDCLAFTDKSVFHHNMGSEAVFCPYEKFPQVRFSIASEEFFSKKIALNDDVLNMSGTTFPLSRVIAMLNAVKDAVIRQQRKAARG